MEEVWIETGSKSNDCRTVIAISNMGRLKRKNGLITKSKLKHHIRINGKPTFVHRIIAEHFIIDCHRPDQIFVDHITHNPIGMNFNDVRNLRWCTKKENSNFEEAKNNMSKASTGRKHTEEYKENMRNLFKDKLLSDFSKKYFEHYKCVRSYNIKQFNREKQWYHTHNNKCRWE